MSWILMATSDSPMARAPRSRWADRLLEARDAGANEQQLQRTAAEGMAEMYFRNSNTPRLRSVGFTGVEEIQIELELSPRQMPRPRHRTCRGRGV